MVDVFPRRNLPGKADVWGREVETRTSSNELSIEALQQALSGQNRNTASSLSVLARQLQDIQVAQDELLARITVYGEEDYETTVVQGTPLPFDTGDLAPVEFSLTETRSVHLRASSHLTLNAVNDGSESLIAFVRAYLRVNVIRHHDDGTDERFLLQTSFATGAGFLNSGVPTRALSEQRAFVEDYMDLPPGRYTATTSTLVEALNGTSSSARIVNARTSVQVLQEV